DEAGWRGFVGPGFVSWLKRVYVSNLFFSISNSFLNDTYLLVNFQMSGFSARDRAAKRFAPTGARAGSCKGVMAEGGGRHATMTAPRRKTKRDLRGPFFLPVECRDDF